MSMVLCPTRASRAGAPLQISPKKEMEVHSLFLIIKAKLTATTFHQQEKKMNIKFVMHLVKIRFTLMVQVYFPFTRDYENEFLTKEKYTEVCAILPTPQKASGSLLKSMWSFKSNKHIIVSTIYRWLFRRKAFYRHCIPRSISIINDITIVKNLYP